MKFVCCKAFLSLAATSSITVGAIIREPPPPPLPHPQTRTTDAVEQIGADAGTHPSQPRNWDGILAATPLSQSQQQNTFPLIASMPISKGTNVCHDMRRMDVIRKTNSTATILIHSEAELAYHITNANNNNNELLTVEHELTAKLHKTRNPEPYTSEYIQRRGYDSISFFNCYRSVAASYDTEDDLITRYPTLAERIDIGPSYLKTIGRGGYEMRVLKLTNSKSTVTAANKSHLFVLCSIHARERAPSESCIRFAEHILESYVEADDADLTWIMNYTEIHMVIQGNPDGRADDEANEGYFRRKNMHFDPATTYCRPESGGVDLNRNFPHSEWGKVGVRFNKCSQIYPGTSGGSEPETQNIIEYIKSVVPPGMNEKDMNGMYALNSTGVMMDMHSFGQDFFWSWAWQTPLTPNEEGLRAMGNKLASHTTPRYSTNNPSCCAGVSTDWGYEYLGIATFAMELGTEFYQACDTFEQTVVPNVLRSLIYSARVSKAPYLYTKGPDVMQINVQKDVAVDTIVVTVKVSDSERAGGYTTGSQNIAEIALYVNTHPYEMGATPDYLSTSGYTSPTETRAFTVDVSTLTVGERHIIYTQAKDATGTPGPVHATFYTKPPPLVCSNKNEQTLLVQIKTDKKKGETSFSVKKQNRKKKFRPILKQSRLKRKSINWFYACVNINRFCYMLTVNDKGQDGIDNGHIRMFRDGVKFYNKNFEAGSLIRKRFGFCSKEKID